MIGDRSLPTLKPSIRRSGIEQVTRSSRLRLDEVTQQNAALVEESAAAAESLKHQASNLAALVASFKLPGGTASKVAAPAVPGPSASAKPLARSATGKSVAGTTTAATRPNAPSAPSAAVVAVGQGDDWTAF